MKKFKYIFFTLIITITFYVGLSPITSIQEMERLIQEDSTSSSEFYNAFELQTSSHEKAFKEAVLIMSANDSISLIINLKDSTASLFIKGVTLHSTKISYIKIDPIITKFNTHVYQKLFGKPLLISKQKATIIKEPIVVIHAPKDTLEAALNAYKPDTLIQNPAYIQMKLEHNLHIIMEQEDNPRLNDIWTRFLFRVQNSVDNSLENLINFSRLRKPTYHPYIQIKIPVDDLRSIYRALPNQPQVVVYF